MAQTFKNRVLAVVAKIPRGQTRSYKEVAKLAGSPSAYRAVANIMARNRDCKIPCHRVIRADGNPGGYSFMRGTSLLSREAFKKHGVKIKIQMLRKEGVMTL